MEQQVIFSRKTLGKKELNNRIVMAPMTRSRTEQPGDIPTDLMATYYAQRASAGLIVSEATQITPQGKGYSFTPGLHSEEQVAGWKKVTDAVHAAGGTMFSQLWHVGRMSHESFHEDGKPVAPSALAPDAKVWVVGDDGVGRMVDCPVPRELANSEIKDIINDYRTAAANARKAGFDGVEIHGGNGYLIDQFLRATANKRTDEYGGPIENRIRFVVEIATAVCEEIGADRVGIRLAPFITQRGMNDPEATTAILAAAKEFNRLGLAYVHLAEADWDDAPVVTDEFRDELRKVFDGSIIVAGNYTQESGNAIIEKGWADFVAYGRKFISNPDLPARFEQNLPLAEIGDPSTLFGGDAKGYTDYAAV